MLLVNLFFLLAVVMLVYYTYYFHFPHCHYKYLSFISPDAQIVDIIHSKERWGRERFIKTIVKFSDGFEYHTHRTFSEPGFLYRTIYVDDEVRKDIVLKAIKAHDRLVTRKLKKFNQ